MRGNHEVVLSKIFNENSNISNQFEEYSKMLFVKFDSFSAGSMLVNSIWGGYGVAGIKPYIGSLLIMIPRAIWPERPVAGSIDGTIRGIPARIVPSYFNIKSDFSNVGVSKLHITLWQLGLIGSVVFIGFVLLFLLVINQCLYSSYYFTRILGVYLLGLPSLDKLISSPDIVVKEVIIVTCLLWIYRLNRAFFLKKNKLYWFKKANA